MVAMMWLFLEEFGAGLILGFVDQGGSQEIIL
jgi:hypothetical protein